MFAFGYFQHNEKTAGVYGLVSILVVVGIVGLAYCARKWRDPPAWAVAVGGGSAFRGRWHQS